MEELADIFTPKRQSAVGGNLTVREGDQPEIDPMATPIGQAFRQLQDITKFDEEVARESAAAAERNRLVFEELQATQETNLEEVLDAYQNMEKISRIPFGLGEVMGIFDKRYNAQVQGTRVEAAQVRSQIQTMRAKTRIDLNNQSAEIKRAQLAAAEKGLERAAFAVDLQGKALTMENQTLDAMSKRDAITNARIMTAIEHLSDEEIPRQLALARRGEGEFVGLEGLLEEQIDKKRQFELTLRNLVANINQSETSTRKMNQEMLDKQMHDFADTIPVDIAEKIAAAGGVEFDMAPFGAPGVKIPVNIIAQHAAKNREIQDKRIQGAAQRAAEIVNEKEGRAFAGITGINNANPREAQNLLEVLKAQRARVTLDNPQSQQAYSATLDAIHDRIVKEGEKYANTFSSAEAKAGYKQFLEDGEFTVPAAGAVTKEYAINPSATGNGLYKDPYEIFSLEVLKKAREQNIEGFEGVDIKNPRVAEMYSMFAALRSGDKIEKIQPALDAVMADPEVRNRVRTAMEGVRQDEIFKRALANIAASPGAAPVWKQVSDQIRRDERAGIQTEVPQILYFLEQQSLKSRGVMDYNGLLLGAIAEAGRESGAGPQTSSRYTDADQALETHIFGFRAADAIAQNYARAVGQSLQQVRQKIQDDINADLATEKQRAEVAQVYKQQVRNADPTATGNEPGVLPPELVSPYPSRAIPGMTTGDIVSLFGR